MNYENMSIEELEAKEKDLKAEYYDIDERKIEIKNEIDIIRNRKKELSELKEEVNEETKEEVSQEEPQEVVEEQNSVDTPVIPTVENNEEAQVSEVQEEVAPVIPTVENNEETQVSEVQEEVAPVIPTVELPKVEESVQEEVNPQALDQVPVAQEEIKPVVEENKNEIYEKIDDNAPKAILIKNVQGINLRKSNEMQQGIVVNSFNNENSVSNETQDVSVSINNDQKVDATPLTPTVKIEEESTSAVQSNDIDSQLQQMIEQLKVTTDEAKAAELNNKISELSKAKVLQKAA